MKQDIHPKYYTKATATCSCGAKHVVGSTKEKMTVEICSECHPFYTGKEKLVDTVILSSHLCCANFDYPMDIWRKLLGGDIKILAHSESVVMPYHVGGRPFCSYEFFS